MTSFYRLVTLCIFFTIFGYLTAISQTNIAQKEKDLVKLYSKLTSFIQGNYDSIVVYSDKFETEFTKFIQNNPATFNYSFKRFIDSNFCDVRTSTDGNFRIYSWDTWTGGTQHVFQTIYQWKSEGKVFTKIPKYEEVDPGTFCSKIFTVNIKGRQHYLAVTNGILSTKDAVQIISDYTIQGNKLIDTIPIFKTKTKELNSIDVEFDFFSVVDRPERPLELIKYDDKRKTIYIPVVDEKGQVTKRNLLYQLKGNYFEFIGVETGMRK